MTIDLSNAAKGLCSRAQNRLRMFKRLVPAQQQPAMHALIIEDEGLIALAIEDVLRECGFTSFDVAPSPEAAIEAASRQCPTLITSGVQLKPGCGIETVLQIYDKQLLPVIFITGNARHTKRAAGSPCQ